MTFVSLSGKVPHFGLYLSQFLELEAEIEICNSPEAQLIVSIAVSI